MLKIGLLNTDPSIIAQWDILLKYAMNNASYGAFKFGKKSDLFSFIIKMEGYINILFLPVTYCQENGIALAVEIHRLFPEIRIVFLGYEKDSAKIEEIFEAEPSYFLFLPLEERRMKKCLDCLIKQLKNERGHMITLKNKKGVHAIFTENIRYIESDKRKVLFYLEQEQLTFYERLDHIQELLGERFIRCHQSFIVNMGSIKNFHPDGILLYTGEMIPISRKRYYAVKKEYIQFIAKCNF